MVLRRLALALLMLLPLPFGCGGGHTGDVAAPIISNPAPAAAAANLFVVQPGDAVFLPATPAYILKYDKTATGNPAPLAEITSPNQVLFGSVALDAAGNLYTLATDVSTPIAAISPNLLVYAPAAVGAATPSSTIRGPQNSGGFPFTLDAAGNLYLTFGHYLNVYAAGRYDAPPIRAISAPDADIVNPTYLFDATALAVDPAGAVHVLDGTLAYNTPNTPVLTYAPTLSGTTLPTSILYGDKTGIASAAGLAVDAAGNTYVGSFSSLEGPGAILVFAPGASGNVAPIRTITGPATTLGRIAELHLDAAGNLYVLTIPPTSTHFGHHILTFAPNASGNVAPVADLSPQTLPENVQQDFGSFAVE